MKKVLVFILCLIVTVPEMLAASPNLKVVTTMSTFADLVSQVGGDRVSVVAIAKPTFNPHFIEPRPSDVLKVKRADLFVHGGLDLELWKGPLLDAAGRADFKGNHDHQLNLSLGIPLLEVPTSAISRAEGDIHIFGNPHFWLSPDNALIMLKAIKEKLLEMDQDGMEYYSSNFNRAVISLRNSMVEWRKGGVSLKGKEFVPYHNAWPYLTKFFGIRVAQFLEPKPGIAPSPGHIWDIKRYIKNNGVKGIIVATYSPKSDANAISDELGISIVQLCQNVKEKSECANFHDMISYNLKQLLEAAK